MLRSITRWSNTSSLICRIPFRRYHWVYNDGEDGYDDKRIEQKLMSISQGGKINLDVIDEVSVVTIDNPEKRNALTGSMIVSLRDVVKRLWDCERSKAVVLCGEGPAFCSGLDLNLAAGLTSLEDGLDMCMYMQNTLTAFQLLPKLTVAAISGPALGGGAEVVTAADFRLMYPDSKIQFLQKKMGITPGWGGATRLRKLVGQRKAMYLLASSEVVDSKSALLIGLADALASDADSSSVGRAAIGWLDQRFRLNGTHKLVFSAIKESALGSSYNASGRLPIDYMMRREKDILASVWGKPPNVEALQRIRTKR